MKQFIIYPIKYIRHSIISFLFQNTVEFIIFKKMYSQHECEDIQFPLGNWKIEIGNKLLAINRNRILFDAEFLSVYLFLGSKFISTTFELLVNYTVCSPFRQV